MQQLHAVSKSVVRAQEDGELKEPGTRGETCKIVLCEEALWVLTQAREQNREPHLCIGHCRRVACRRCNLTLSWHTGRTSGLGVVYRWSSFYNTGGKEAGLQKSAVNHIWGALIAAIALIIVDKVGGGIIPLILKEKRLTYSALRNIVDLQIRLYCLALLRRNGRPFSITSSMFWATGRQTARPYPTSGGMLMKLSMARPPLKPMAARVE
jgi:hypothetical protein